MPHSIPPLSLLVVMLVLCFASPAQAQRSELVVEHDSYAMGTVRPDSVIQHTFVLSNQGFDSLRVLRVRHEDPRLETRYRPDAPIAPGDTAHLVLTFRAAPPLGRVATMTSIQTDAARRPAAVRFTGRLAPALPTGVTQGGVLFDRVTASVTVPPDDPFGWVRFEMHNQRNQPLTVLSDSTSMKGSRLTYSSRTLAPSDAIEVGVYLDAPGLAPGTETTIDVWILTDDPKRPRKHLAVRLNVSNPGARSDGR